MERLRQSEVEAGWEYLQGEGDGKSAAPRPRTVKCRTDGCPLQAPVGQEYCSTHQRQMMTAAVLESRARRGE